uniref:Uncharacterized protein n=1 Tax=Vannella robusta TaxID=1487602 RepID=A0A7S4HJJ6_9EUKA|mmetsp:Transcript_11560/g.14348  ORF Transcript_11560/g.14348 Transcript_11560/m.14348 type:complete len:180 (+) Transcript_11560:595-1134(+)
MEKIVVIARVPWKRPEHLLPEFWTSERDQKLWYFVHKATKSNKPIDWKFIASALGCTVTQCVERSQVMYNNKIEQLQSHLNDSKENLFRPSFIEKEHNSKQETQHLLNNEDTALLRKLVEKHEFNWKQIAEEWLSGTYDPIKCREIYHSLPSEEYDHLSETDISLSQLDSALFSSSEGN